MKHFLLLAVIGYSVAVSSQVAIPDPVFKSKLLAASVDTNLDNEIQESEAEVITVLNLNYIAGDPAYITDLTGIEAFANLEQLRVNGHHLTSLDVTMLPSLQVLQCSDNLLTNLNFSGLQDLVQVRFMNNLVTEIDLTGLPNLTHLTCFQNQLSSINVTQSPLLLSLGISNNELSELDLTNNVQLESLMCGGNNLSNLQVNHLSELLYLECGFNPMTTLDLAGMMNLNTLDISGSSLEEIDITSTAVTSLHASYCPNLQQAYLKNNLVSMSDPDLLFFQLLFIDTPALEFVCIDEGEQLALDVSGYNIDNPDVVVSTTSCELAVDEHEAGSQVMLYPNPVSDIAIIESDMENPVFAVYDAMGKVLLQSSSKKVTEDFIPMLTSGIYFLLISRQQSQATSKFIKL